MGEIWVIAEVVGDGPARVSTEVATLARRLGVASGRPVVGVVVAADPDAAARGMAAYLPDVLSIRAPEAGGETVAAAARRLVGLVERRQPDHILVAATPDGRDLAGTLSALLGWGVLVNALDVVWAADGPSVEMSVLGGRLLTSSAFVGGHGIITVRPNAVTAEPAERPGVVVEVDAPPTTDLPVVRVVERRSEQGAAASIEEARVIVAGGRGVGGPDGFRLIDDLAQALGGAVGATRAAVDAGWIPYAQQIGQTGKVVKPSLYLALGISGAIQHKVGMQTAETIVAVNRDPDAPLAEFADLYVVGDLFEVGPALLAELRARGH
jgi:electron transfer flavoprotein alpha subunit